MRCLMCQRLHVKKKDLKTFTKVLEAKLSKNWIVENVDHRKDTWIATLVR